MNAEADDYVDTARQRLGEGALPQQQQTLTLALLLAVCDLRKQIEVLIRAVRSLDQPHDQLYD